MVAARRRRQLEEEELHFRNAGEVRLRSRWRRTMMGWERWSEMKALVIHNGGRGGGQKKRAVERRRVALRECQVSQAGVRAEEDGDGSRIVVRDEGSRWPQ